MIHPHRSKDTDPARRSRLLSRYLDPEYIGHSTPNIGSLPHSRSPSLPQASVFVDRYGEEHDPDFRPFASYPVITPAAEEHSWPWDDNEVTPTSIMGSTSPRSRTSHSNSQSTTDSYNSSQSSGTRSMPASALPSPSLEPEKPTQPPSDDGRRPIAPPAHIPRSALFPWTPAQRAVRVQHEVNKRNIPPPPTFIEEEREESPLTLVDSRYVPGYGHIAAPPSLQQRAHTAPEESKDKGGNKCGRARAHTVPAESESRISEDEPPSPSCSFSLRQSVYSFGLKTKLRLHHMKVRVRKASNAAKRPLSL